MGFHFSDLGKGLAVRRRRSLRGKAIHAVQILTFSDDTLTLRGVMDHGSPVRRSLLDQDPDGADAVEEVSDVPAGSKYSKVTSLPGGKKIRGVNQDKGQEAALRTVLEALRDGAKSPVALPEIVVVSDSSIQIAAQAQRNPNHRPARPKTAAREGPAVSCSLERRVRNWP